MKLKFFIIISTICLILSKHVNNAKPASTTYKQDSKCFDKSYVCTDDIHDPKHPAYKDKDACGFIDKSCTHIATTPEGDEPRVFKQRFKPGPGGMCVLAGCCCRKHRRSDSSA